MTDDRLRLLPDTGRGGLSGSVVAWLALAVTLATALVPGLLDFGGSRASQTTRVETAAARLEEQARRIDLISSEQRGLIRELVELRGLALASRELMAAGDQRTREQFNRTVARLSELESELRRLPYPPEPRTRAHPVEPEGWPYGAAPGTTFATTALDPA